MTCQFVPCSSKAHMTKVKTNKSKHFVVMYYKCRSCLTKVRLVANK